GSGDARAADVLRALAAESLRFSETQVFIVDGETARDAVSGHPATLPDLAEDAMVNNRLRGALDTALAGIEPFPAGPARQREAARSLQRNAFNDPDPAGLPLIEKALAGDLDAQARQSLELAQAAMQLASDDAAVRLAAAVKLGEARQPIVRPLIEARLTEEASADVKAALARSLAAIDRRVALASGLAQAFTGIS